MFYNYVRILQVGVKNIVLAVNYQADVMTKFLKEYEEKVLMRVLSA